MQTVLVKPGLPVAQVCIATGLRSNIRYTGVKISNDKRKKSEREH